MQNVHLLRPTSHGKYCTKVKFGFNCITDFVHAGEYCIKTRKVIRTQIRNMPYMIFVSITNHLINLFTNYTAE